jgi:3-isopropylmalate/(R)-2-methylmalate dehydratase large subunit
MSAPAPRTLFENVWSSHVVVEETPDTPAVLYIDLHLIHEVTTPQAFDALRAAGLRVRRPDLTLGTLDHSTPTTPVRSFRDLAIVSESAAQQVTRLQENCRDFGIELYAFDSPHRGIVHVIGPELGITQPGKTIVCGDSHTSTHGAFGALAFGIGTTEVGHVLATQCLLQRKPRTLAIEVSGTCQPGVTAKDLILAAIAQVGVAGGAGHVIEYRGAAIQSLDMEARMTICNMSIEAGARAGMIAPDETTLAYLQGRPGAPAGEHWEAAASRWLGLRSDADAVFDRTVSVRGEQVQPMVTFGTNPAMAVPIGAPVPHPNGDTGLRKALDYMQITAGKPLTDCEVDLVFLGSCTNARLSDLQQAASILRGRHIAPGVRMLVVPGSQAVKRAAEELGLDEVFKAAGAEWRESGCSMCLGMNGDTVPRGKLCVSTSNRNFEGRQGPGARTVLASPLTAAASAVCGRVADPRPLLH